MIKKTERSIKKKIEEDFLKQLKGKNVTQEYYTDLIRDYLSLWDTKNKLQKDIKTRGVSIQCISREGNETFKKNESISELVKVNNQMLKIISDLGLRISDLKVVDDDEEL